MGDLIDRDALYAELQKHVGSPEGHRRLMEANQCICDAPAVDAVPVVRCVDCAHCYDPDSDPLKPYSGGKWWYCRFFDMDYRAHIMDPRTFYCAEGKRREARRAD